MNTANSIMIPIRAWRWKRTRAVRSQDRGVLALHTSGARGTSSWHAWLCTLLLCASSLWLATPGVAQLPGSNDASFHVADDGTYGYGPTGSGVAGIVLQPDGKLLIAGGFDEYNFAASSRIARTNVDGSLDSSFDPGLGGDLGIAALTLQPDGKVLVGGSFTTFDGTPRSRVARLNGDGSLDLSFNPGSGANNYVYRVALQLDGKFLIAGEFTSYDGIARHRVARLNADGSLDPSFDPGTGPNSTVNALAVQPDGKVVIGGQFTSYDGTMRSHIARLNTDGTVDVSFDPGAGADNAVWSLASLPDGKVLIGGRFASYDGTPRNRIARLNVDGSLDTSFNSGAGPNSTVYSLTVQADGKVLIGGIFTSHDGVTRNRIARLNHDASIDVGFDPGIGPNDDVDLCIPQPDGKVFIGGDFFACSNIARYSVARLNDNGSLDTSFNPSPGPSSTVRSIAVQPDNKLLIGGDFVSCSDVARNRIARLSADGDIDASFNPGSGAGGNSTSVIESVSLQPDGKVIVSGNFTLFDGVVRGRVARLNADGSLDPSFTTGLGADNWVWSHALQPDGKLLIGGYFNTYNGFSRSKVARLNANGSLDATFNPGSGANLSVEAVVLQADGRVLIGGSFTSYNGVARNRIARLNANGSLDLSFDPGSGASDKVQEIVLQPDGRVLIAGYFTSYGGVTRNRIARLHADGSLDTSFDPGAGVEGGDVWSLFLQAQGKVLIGGYFTTVDGTARNGIARLNADGSLDTSFDPGSGTSSAVKAFASQTDGRLMVGGYFTTYDGIRRTRLARIYDYESYTTYCDGPALACPCGNSGSPGNGCGNSINAAGANLAASGYASLASDTLVLAGSGMPNSSALYFQGTTQSGGGLGTAFGDGLRCAGGAVIRLGTKINASNVSSYPEPGDASISVRGAVTTPGSLRTYQCWYRNAAAFCTPSTFNLSNGVSVNWGA